MVTADRSAPLRRVGSLLGLLGLEVAAVAALHWLGRLPALRIPWERPLPWLLDSPVQDVLGSLVRMVGLVMAYWLLASSVLYLLASLSHLPAAVRAVRWLTLPLVRRVADHAVAVTLATSMVGGGTLATAGPAGAAPGRGGVGPPARRPVASALAPDAHRPWAASQPTSGTAGQDEPSQPRYRPRPAGQEPTTTGQGQSQPRYRPRPAGQEPPPPEPASSATGPERTPPSTQPTTTTAPATTAATTTTAPTTTGPTTSQSTTTAATTTAATTTTGPSTTTATTGPPSAQPAPTTTRPRTTTEPATTATTGSGSGRPARAAGQPTTTTALRPPAYRFNPAGTTTTTTTTTTPPEAGQGSGQPGGGQGSGSKSGSSGGGESGGQDSGGAEQATSHRVVRGDNLWAIARDRLAEVSGRRAAELSDREIAAYWATVVEANRGRLRSRDPDLIYPGEVVELPPVSGS
jgi:uncharacterized membrane protein YgcG